MTKTQFSSGVIVTSAWLNGAQNIYFDGQSLDWHYDPLGLNSLVTGGSNGLDSRYITLGTDQPSLAISGLYISGTPITGTKVVTGVFNFGYDPNVLGNPSNSNGANAPQNYTTNAKYLYAGGTPAPSTAQKFASLSNSDIITKAILADQVTAIAEGLEVDNGVYYSATNPACNNYSVGTGGNTIICPN